MNRAALLLLVFVLVAAALAVMLWLPVADDPEPTGDATGRGDAGQEQPLEGLPQPATLTAPDRSRERVTIDPGGGDSGSESAIRGRILGADGRPLRGALVALFPVHAFDSLGFSRAEIESEGVACGADGSFVLEVDAPNFRYRVGAAAKDYAPYRSDALDPGSQVEITLQPVVWVPGVVVRGDGSAVTDARVLLTALDLLRAGLPDPVETDAEGRFRVAAPGAGSYALRVQSGTAGTALVEPLAVSEGMPEVTVTLDGGAGFLVRLLDEANAPVPAAQVTLQFRGSRTTQLGLRSASSDARGEVRFDAVEDGTWLLRAEAEGFAPLAQILVRLGPGMQTWEGVMARPGALEVLVLDAKGRVVPGLPVRIHATQGASFLSGISPQQSTSDEGVAEWPVLVPGRYVVRSEGQPGSGEMVENMLSAASKGAGEGGESGSVVIATVHAGLTTEAQLKLWDLAMCRVRVLAGTEPRARAQARLSRDQRGAPPAPQRWVPTDADGWASLPPVWPGVHRLEVRVDGNVLTPGVTLELTAGEELEHVVQLPSGSLRGRVTSGAGAVSECRAVLVGAGEETSFRASQPCDDAGRFAFELLPEGDYNLTLEGPWVAPWSSPRMHLDGVQAVDVGEVSLSAAAFLIGRAAGVPVTELGGFDLRFAELRDSAGALAGGDALAGDGSYRIGPVAPGTYVLTVIAGGTTVGTQRVVLAAGENRFDFSAR